MRCDEYDYIEIVCLYKYPIKITTKMDETITGTALDTQYNTNREECIKINCSNTAVLIAINTIAKLDVCVSNPHFTTFSFT